MGAGSRFQVIYRKEGWTDEQFKEEAIRQFDEMILRETIVVGEIVKTGYVL